MTFINFLKYQLADYVESYKKYFWQTSGTVLVYTVACFAVISLLFMYRKFDIINVKKQVSLLSYFFTRYSNRDIYSLVDLSKTVFIFFVALFSVGITRLTSDETDKKNELSFGSFIKTLRGKDFISLLSILIVCSAFDFGMVQLDNLSQIKTQNFSIVKWLYSMIFLLRIYVPLILFSITINRLISEKLLKLNFTKLIFLFISLWIFNEFAYEVFIFVKTYLFEILFSSLNEDRKYLYESFLGIPLMAFYFLGYYSAMTTSLKQLEDN